MTALAYLKYLRDRIPLPMTPEVMKRADRRPSNSELRRWLTARSVIINGQVPKADEMVDLPVFQLIFFPKGKRRSYL